MASGGLSLIRSLVLSLRFFYLFIYYHDFFFDGIGSKRRHFEWRDNLSWLAPLSHWKFPRIKYRFIWLIFTLTQRLRSDIIPKIYFWKKNHCTNPKCEKRTLLKKLRFFMWLLSFGWVLSFFSCLIRSIFLGPRRYNCKFRIFDVGFQKSGNIFSFDIYTW